MDGCGATFPSPRRRALRLAGGLAAVTVAFALAYAPALQPAQAATSAIMPVGSLFSAAGSGVSTLNVDPQAAGDALVVVVKVSSPTLTVSSLTSGAVGSWSRLERFNDGSHDDELWLGTVTTPGATTLQVAFSGSASGDDVDLDAQEFGAGFGAATTWTKGDSGGQSNPSSRSVRFPSLAPSGTGELYVGYARSTGTLSSGSTAGFTYDTTADGNLIAYDTATSGTVAPQATVAPASTSAAVAVLLEASGTATRTPTVAAVGGVWDAVYNGGGTTLAVDAVASGDVLVVTVDSHFPYALSSVSGGGVAVWEKAVQFVSARGHDIELWYGTVSTPGVSQITVTWPSPGPGGYWTELTAQEFSSGLGAATTWSVDGGQAASVNGPDSTTLPFPQATPSSAGDLYYGFAGIPNVPVEGSTPGFTYEIDAGANVICYDPDVTSTVAPTASQVPAGLSELVGALLHASTGG